MGVMAKPSGDFKPAPEGQAVAVVVDVIDEGMKPGFKGKMVPKIRVVLQINKKMEDGRYFLIHQWYKNSLHKKAALYPLVTALMGRKVEQDEVRKGFDLEAELIGRACMIQIEHNTSDDGRVFANVASAMALPDGISAFEPEGYTRKVDRDDNWSPDGRDFPKSEGDDDIPF